MGLFTRPDSRYWWLWLETAPKGQQKQRTDILVGTTRKDRTASKAAALAVYTREMLRIGQQRHGVSPDQEAVTFRAYATVYARDVISHHKGATRERELLQTLLRAFGDRPLSSLTKEAVRAWMTTRRATVSAATVNREVDLLKVMLRDAVPRYLPASPIAGMSRLQIVPPRRRVLSVAEETRLIAACEDAQDRALLILGIDTLQRLGDLLDLQRSDRRGQWITIRDTKNSEAIDVPLSPRAAETLSAVKGRSRYYFMKFRTAVNPRDWRGAVRQRLEYLCKNAKIPFGRAKGGITWHWATRRTGTTRLLVDKGVPIPVVQRLGNWRRPDVPLAIYSEAQRSDLAKAVGQLPEHSRSLKRRRKQA